jgi:hypothetical protein
VDRSTHPSAHECIHRDTTYFNQLCAAQGIIRSGDLPIHRTMLAPQAEGLKENLEFQIAVDEYLAQPGNYDIFLESLERSILSRLLTRYNSIKDLCKAIGLARSTFDGKRRRLGILTADTSPE